MARYTLQYFLISHQNQRPLVPLERNALPYLHISRDRQDRLTSFVPPWRNKAL